MKKYTNRTHDMKTVTFVDGTSQFLMKGQSCVSSKDTKRVEKGIKVTDVRKTKTRTVSQEDETEK